jgi:hypothetical protein
MTDKARIRIAAAVTALFVAGISFAGLAAREDGPVPATTTPAATAPATTATIDDSVSVARRSDDRYESDDGYERGERYEEVEDDE